MAHVCDDKELQTLVDCANSVVHQVTTQERSHLTQEYPEPISGFKNDGAGIVALSTLLQARLEADFFRKGWEEWQLRIIALCICEQFAIFADDVRFVKVKDIDESFAYSDLRAPDAFQIRVYHDRKSDKPIAWLDLYPWLYEDVAGDPAIHWHAPWSVWTEHSKLYKELLTTSDSEEVIDVVPRFINASGEFVSGLSPITRDIDIDAPSPRRIKGTNYHLADTGELIIGSPTDTNDN